MEKRISVTLGQIQGHHLGLFLGAPLPPSTFRGYAILTQSRNAKDGQSNLPCQPGLPRLNTVYRHRAARQKVRPNRSPQAQHDVALGRRPTTLHVGSVSRKVEPIVRSGLEMRIPPLMVWSREISELS